MKPRTERTQITTRLILKKGFNAIAIEGDLSSRPVFAFAAGVGKRVKKRPKSFHLGTSLRGLVQTGLAWGASETRSRLQA